MLTLRYFTEIPPSEKIGMRVQGLGFRVWTRSFAYHADAPTLSHQSPAEKGHLNCALGKGLGASV